MSEILKLANKCQSDIHANKSELKEIETKQNLVKTSDSSVFQENVSDKEKQKENEAKEYVKKASKKTKWIPYQAEVSIIPDKACLNEADHDINEQRERDQQRKNRPFQRRRSRYFSGKSRNNNAYKYQHGKHSFIDYGQEEHPRSREYDQKNYEYLDGDIPEKRHFGVIGSENHQNPFLPPETNQQATNAYERNHSYIQPVNYPYVPTLFPYSPWIPSYQMFPSTNGISPSLQQFPNISEFEMHTSGQPTSDGSTRVSSTLRTPSREDDGIFHHMTQQNQNSQGSPKWMYFNPPIASPQGFVVPTHYNLNRMVNSYPLAFPPIYANGLYPPYYASYYPALNEDNNSNQNANEGITHVKTERHQLIEKLKVQLKYYFSTDNLCRDVYLRKHMNKEGFVSLQFIFSFSMVKNMAKNDYTTLVEAAKDIDILEMMCENDDAKVRLKNGWEKWVSDSK